LANELGQRCSREVAVLVVDGLDPRAVDRQQLSAEQVELPTQQDKFAEYRAESRAVVAPEIGDGLEVRLQVPQQPDHFEVATGLRFQPPARTHSVQIAVDVELQEIARGIARAAGRLRHDTGEPCRRKVEPINKGVDEPHRVLSADVVVDRLRQKQRLAAVVPGDVRHSRILSRERPRWNPLRPSFHTVCRNFAQEPQFAAATA
jgi:hypothetical protein